REDHAAKPGDVGAPFHQPPSARRKICRLENSRHIGKLLRAGARQRRYHAHAGAWPVERRRLVRDHAAIDLATLNCEIHIASAFVAQDDFALHTERIAHDGGEIGVVVSLARSGPERLLVHALHIGHGADARWRPDHRDFVLTGYAREPYLLAHIVIDT